MIHDHATDNPAAGGLMHSAREGPDFEDILGKNSVKFSGSDEEGFLRCSNFLCFWNLDDVSPDDGGLLLVPGSHKSRFERPHSAFGSFGSGNHPDVSDTTVPLESSVPPGAVHATVRAGDCVLMTEATTHGVLPWVGGGQRRVLALRYTPHGMHGTSSRNGLSPEVQARLAPQTLELCAYVPPGATKTIARRGVVVLPAGPGPGEGGREARL